MTEDRQKLGRRAENKALAHLEAAGLSLVARNWKTAPRPGFGGHGGELDLIMRDGDVLVFVEVRATSGQTGATGRSGFAGGAAYTVGPAKQRRLALLAQLFLARYPDKPRALRFDVVALTRTGVLAWEVRWYRNAFQV